MKKLLFPILLSVSVSCFAQRKELKPFIVPNDTLNKKNKCIGDTIGPTDQEKNFYNMPTAKPSEGAEYSSLKDTGTDRTDYRMLNAMKPEELQTRKADNFPKSRGK
ncbi:hypothetical protein [Chryseobacterium hagamense]|uniref:Lipoprotein n=1 Tax=Chryseobacterium hagamense TaxID=395935 RepID=A0A511YGW1_9FLAO|nr:hypothetical protein [Chryseobacterium hagamense]GEN74447.1 hypothetical protein CHA01nite_01870 [Chryseobacterium hagamense]